MEQKVDVVSLLVCESLHEANISDLLKVNQTKRAAHADRFVFPCTLSE